MNPDKCATKRCRNDSELFYLGKPLCDNCWVKQCEESDKNWHEQHFKKGLEKQLTLNGA